ncbi:hypothetical protein ACFU0X_10540 [Streptomyces cellulosae]|uniref:HTH crp-type domain-containing protein n=1 Tax=Streptomyces cellulosae TaxID=1968 RepID=A0ABW6JDN1_STRCE
MTHTDDAERDRAAEQLLEARRIRDAKIQQATEEANIAFWRTVRSILNHGPLNQKQVAETLGYSRETIRLNMRALDQTDQT